MSKLEDALRLAREGRPQFVLVEGEAGIGKSTLLEAFLSALSAQGGPVAVRRARADELQSGRPFGLLEQVLAGRGGAGALEDGSDALVAGAELLEQLGALQGDGRPVVVVLEDVHFADTPSCAAIVFALRRLLADRALTVATTRPGPYDDGWRRLASGPGGQRLVLVGLDREDLRSLARSVGRKLSEAELAWLGDATEGHPLYALNVLLAGNLEREVPLPGRPPPSPPPTLAELVVSRLQACSPGARDLVAAVAVHGRSASVAEAAALAEGVDVPAAIEECVDAGIFIDPGVPALRLRFTHALVHAACYQSLGRRRLVQLHSRAAEVTAGLQRLQHRLAAASGPDPGLAGELEVLARSELGAGAVRAAGEHLLQAAEVGPPGPEADRRLLEAVETWLISGEARRALPLQARARAASPGPYRDHVLAYLALVSGRFPEAELGFRRAWAAVRGGARFDGPDDLAARVAVCMTVLVVLNLDRDDMLRWAEAALATAPDDVASRSFAWFCSALALGTVGRGAEALVRLDGEGVPDTADVMTARGMVEMWCDELGRAREHLSMAFARSLGGEPVRVTQLIGMLAECEYRSGHLGESSVHAELAVDAATDAERIWDLPLLHSLAAYPAAATGNFALAEGHVRQAADWAASLPIPAFRAYAAAAAVSLALARDDVDALLEAATSLEDAYIAVDPGVACFGPVLAEALLRADRPGDAEGPLEAFEARATRYERRSALLGAARVRGQLEAARGDLAAAGEAFSRGALLARGLGLPIEVARFQEAYGSFLLRCGEHEAGSARVAAAARAYQRSGAAAYARRLRAGPEEGLAGAPGGGGGQGAGAVTALAMSPAETMVAHLVAQGRSNKQIAAELVVSVKTVEYHLSNIYRRLGVTSRVRLAQAVADEVRGARGPGASERASLHQGP